MPLLPWWFRLRRRQHPTEYASAHGLAWSDGDARVLLVVYTHGLWAPDVHIVAASSTSITILGMQDLGAVSGADGDALTLAGSWDSDVVVEGDVGPRVLAGAAEEVVTFG